ncbi:MAG: class I SAM-dependent methyltransferase [Candidatus Eisenbacteria bacterium]|nr:class I SAM-dependent methyltransferase [Candidatus Eisenbacteria bacterium]
MRAALAGAPRGGDERIPDHAAFWRLAADDARLMRDIEHLVHLKRPLYAVLLEAIAETEARRVLEVGAGSTIDSCWLAARCEAEFHALDAAATAAEHARRVGRLFPRRVHLHRGDGFRAPFAGGTFDVLFHQGLLEHFANPRPLLAENVRLLRPGGILVVDVPQRYNLYTLRKRLRMRRGDWPWGWEREYTPREIERLVLGLPLELLRLSGWGYERYSALARWPWRKVSSRLPLERSAALRSIDRLHARFLEPVWEAPWRALEERFGPWWLMNVTGVFRRLP